MFKSRKKLLSKYAELKKIEKPTVPNEHKERRAKKKKILGLPKSSSSSSSDDS